VIGETRQALHSIQGYPNMFSNQTKNQHFISQAEQRLNAQDAKRKRIYAFDIERAQQPALRNPQLWQIEKTLPCFDLFSFDVGHRDRSNFESQFGRYEAKAVEYTQSLLAKLSAGDVNVKQELLELFALKLLNFLRNPFSVDKVLNTFGLWAGHIPTDPVLLAAFERVRIGNREQAPYICERFGLAASRYDEWLKTLFILLAPISSATFFEQTVATMFTRNVIQVFVHRFSRTDSSNVCLLSDRGFNVLEQSPFHFVIEFNLCSRAFVTFNFSSPEEFTSNRKLIEAACGRINVDYMQDSVEQLVRFNQRTMHHCHSKVFAAVKSPRMAL
jgi:hypothetical protein